jgi:hypothetical protein
MPTHRRQSAWGQAQMQWVTDTANITLLNGYVRVVAAAPAASLHTPICTCPCIRFSFFLLRWPRFALTWLLKTRVLKP